MRNPAAGAILLLMSVSVGGCSGSPSGVVCTDEFAYGISIHVSDAATGAPITSGLSGTLTDGSYHENMMPWPSGATLVGAGERKGTYAATVSAPGYQTWQKDGIQVGANECHVVGVSVDAKLTHV